MKQDEIIEMARQAGFAIDGDSWIHAGAVMIDGRKSIDHLLEAFAKLVAAKEREAFKPPAKWRDDEIANGYRGIRWVAADGVYGRPTQEDVEQYLGYTHPPVPTAQPEQKHMTQIPTSEFPAVKAAKEEVKQHIKYYNEMMREPTTYERVIECATRLVEHADFKLGGALSANSKAKDIPSKAVSQVKARHLAALRDALAAHEIKEYDMIEKPLLTNAEIAAAVVMTEPEDLKSAPVWALIHFAQQVAYIGAAKMLGQSKPLTDEEIGAILEGVNAYGTRLYTFARAIEAAHGIKE